MKTILVDAIHTFVIKWEWIFAEMHKLLETYTNPKIILTNADDEQMNKFGLHNMPYPVFTLKHNPDKVESIYYETMLEKYSQSIDNVIYFEHWLEAVKSAKSIWIKTFHYDAKTKDLVKLKEFIDSNL